MNGEFINGNFVTANAATIQVDVAGNRLSIKVDDVANIIFAGGNITPPQTAAKQSSPEVEQALKLFGRSLGQQR